MSVTAAGRPGDVVVVGYDGSPLGTSAASWASALVADLGGELSVVRVARSDRPTRPSDPLRQFRTGEGRPRPTARTRTTPSGRVLREVLTDDMDEPVDPLSRLVGRSALCDLLVLGIHGGPDPDRRDLSRFAETVTRRAHCPVVLVGSSVESRALRRCVVVTAANAGDEHLAALAWAARFARRSHLPVHLLTQWTPGLPSPWERVSDLRVEAARAARRRHELGLRTLRRLAAGEFVWGGYLVEVPSPTTLADGMDSRDLVVTTRGSRAWLAPIVKAAPGAVAVIPPRPKARPHAGPRRAGTT